MSVSSVNRHKSFTALNGQYTLEQCPCIAFQELISCLTAVKNRYGNKFTVIAAYLSDMKIYRNILILVIGNNMITDLIRHDHFFGK